MVKYLVIFVIAIASSSAEDGCTSSYNQRLYEDWNCTPETENGDCPLAYNCQNIWNRPKDKCFLAGEVFKSDKRINVVGLKQKCYFNTACTKYGNKNEIIYAMPMCVPPKNANCRMTFSKIDQCCPDWSSPLSKITCKTGSKTYYEGERFSSTNCRTCLCTKRGIVCQNDKCFTELRFMNDIDARAAPVFEKNDCCPYKFKHPSYSDVLVDNLPNVSARKKCFYGNARYNLNTVIINEQENVSCSCYQPPLFTCFKN